MTKIISALIITVAAGSAGAIDFTPYDAFLTCGAQNICAVDAPFSKGKHSEAECQQRLVEVQQEIVQNGYSVVGITNCHEYESGSFAGRVHFH